MSRHVYSGCSVSVSVRYCAEINAKPSQPLRCEFKSASNASKTRRTYSPTTTHLMLDSGEGEEKEEEGGAILSLFLKLALKSRLEQLEKQTRLSAEDAGCRRSVLKSPLRPCEVCNRLELF